MHAAVERRVAIQSDEAARARAPGAAQPERAAQLRARSRRSPRRTAPTPSSIALVRRPLVLDHLAAERLEALAQAREAAAEIQQHAAHRSKFSCGARHGLRPRSHACSAAPGTRPSVRWQRRIHAISRLNRRFWSRQGKSSTVTARQGTSRQNSPGPNSSAELGPNSATVGVPVSRPMCITLVSGQTSNAAPATRCQSCARSSR